MSHLMLTSAEEALFTINIPQHSTETLFTVEVKTGPGSDLLKRTTAFRFYRLTFTPEERKVPVCTLGAGERVP